MPEAKEDPVIFFGFGILPLLTTVNKNLPAKRWYPSGRPAASPCN